MKRDTENHFNVTYSRMQLYLDEEKFNHSVHHLNGISCVDCHSDIHHLNYAQEVPHNKQLAPVSCTSCPAKAF